MKKTFQYVDVMVVPVSKKNVAQYKKWARLASKVWIEHGAIDYVECMGDDVEPGKNTSFPQSVKLKKGEVVCISWITYKSKSQRNRVMSQVMSDPRLTKFMDSNKMPFDGMRMFWGGFKPFVKV